MRALKKAERTAAKTGVELSAWEGEFLSDVTDRLKTYGRAYADPDKGAPGAARSALQGFKLRQISAKARGDKVQKKRNKFGRPVEADPEPDEAEDP